MGGSSMSRPFSNNQTSIKLLATTIGLAGSS
jgi:hypothetical protein